MRRAFSGTPNGKNKSAHSVSNSLSNSPPSSTNHFSASRQLSLLLTRMPLSYVWKPPFISEVKPLPSKALVESLLGSVVMRNGDTTTTLPAELAGEISSKVYPNYEAILDKWSLVPSKKVMHWSSMDDFRDDFRTGAYRIQCGTEADLPNRLLHGGIRVLSGLLFR